MQETRNNCFGSLLFKVLNKCKSISNIILKSFFVKLIFATIVKYIFGKYPRAENATYSNPFSVPVAQTLVRNKLNVYKSIFLLGVLSTKIYSPDCNLNKSYLWFWRKYFL